MNKKLLSALLAVMMVVSMMACIALPAVAESDITLTEAQALPLASAVDASDSHTKYQINSVSELIAASIASVTSNPTANTTYAFGDGDTLYLTADLDVANWTGWENWATYDEGTGKYTTKGSFIKNPNKTSYNIYSATAPGVECDNLSEVFAALYAGFNARNAKYGILKFDFDGMGHTIKNFYSYCSFYAGAMGAGAVLKNLNLENAVVDTTKENTTLWTSSSPAMIARSADTSGGGHIENVHLTGCTVTTASGLASLFVYFSNKGNATDARVVDLKNCSATDCTVESSAAAPTSLAIFVAGMDHDGAMENCVSIGNTIKAKANPAAVSFGSNVYYGNSRATTYRNLVAINNTLLIETLPEGATEPAAGILLDFHAKTQAVPVTIENLYALNNTWALVTEGVPGVAQPLKNVINDTANAIGNGETVTIGAAIVDTNVVNILNEENPTAGQQRETIVAGAEDKIANLSADMITALKNGTKYAKFVMEDSSVILLDDGTGKAIVDADTKALLSAMSWTANGAPAAIDFDNLTIAADTVYTVAAHTNHIEAIPGDNANHKVVCDNCSEAEHNYTVACADVTAEGTPVAGDYYNSAKNAYTCVCGNSWNVDDANYVAEAPITVTTDAATYGDNDVNVAVTVGAKADSKLAGFVATVTFDPAKLEYAGFTSAFNCNVNAANAAAGTLVVSFAPATGLNLNAEALVMNFKTKAGTEDTTATVAVEITEANVDTGSNIVDTIMPLTTTASVTADITHVEVAPAPVFTAGDVNQDTRINLLDAVTVIQALKNALYDAQVATFQVWAADVDGDNAVTTNDVTLLLKNAVGEAVSLVKATAEPTISA